MTVWASQNSGHGELRVMTCGCTVRGGHCLHTQVNIHTHTGIVCVIVLKVSTTSLGGQLCFPRKEGKVRGLAEMTPFVIGGARL